MNFENFNCPKCGTNLNKAFCVNDDPNLQPKIGDVTVCGHCLATLEFAEKSFIQLHANAISKMNEETQRDLWALKMFISNKILNSDTTKTYQC